MYEEFYGLTEKPFSIQPDPSFLYWGRGHRLAYAMLEYGVVNQAGISVITGEVGCGKTTLIHRLLEQLSDTHTIALLSNIQSGRGELLSWVLMGFGEPFAGKSHVEMFAQLQAFFIREYAKGKRVVLIIDEAQNLTTDMLEEIRMLSNINAGRDQLLQLILVGQPQLKDLLSRPEMLQLAQRVGSDFHLTPLTREEVRAYVETRLSIAGAKHAIFEDAATDLVAEQSRGVPRVINIIADTALVYGFSAQEEVITADIVRSVIRDKIDYGVFGLASSPDLKLSESADTRSRASGFVREESREAPRRVAKLGMKLTSAAKAEAGAAAAAAPRLEEAAVRPAVQQSAHSAQAAVEERPLRADRARPESEAPVAPQGHALPFDPRTVGVVIVGESDGLVESARSIPAGAPVVCVAVAGSVEAREAQMAGLDLVELDETSFSGGRARNAGYRRLKKIAPDMRYVQFVRGGAIIDPDWFEAASHFMERRPEVAALEGRLLTPSAAAASLFQRAMGGAERDDGELQTTGPNAIFRADAFEAAGGFRGDIIADETADLCIRLRRRGAHVWCSEEPMAAVHLKDLDFHEWRERTIEKGYDCAAGAALHGGSPERYCAAEQARALVWGAAFPLMIAIGAVVAGVSVVVLSTGVNPFMMGLSVIAAGLLLYGLRIAAIAAGEGFFRPSSWAYGAAVTLSLFFECAGVLRYWLSSRKGAHARKSIA